MRNAVMCPLSLYDVIGITRHLHIKLNSFSNIAQPLDKEAVRGCSFLYTIDKKSVILSEAFLVDVSIHNSSTFSANILPEIGRRWKGLEPSILGPRKEGPQKKTRLYKNRRSFINTPF